MRDSIWDLFRAIWRSPWTGWVAFRYLKSKKNSRFLSLITVISMGGVALGVTSMIVVLSVMEGFERELRTRLMASDLHVLIEPSATTEGADRGFVAEDRVKGSPEIQKHVASGAIEAVWPIVSTEAILRSGRKVTGVVVKGLESERMKVLQQQVVESASALALAPEDSGGGPPLAALFVGKELSLELGLMVGDQVTMISPTETEGPLSSVPRMKRFRIEGIYSSGIPEQELHTVFSTDQSVRAFLRRAGVLSSWEIRVKDFDEAPEIARSISKSLPDYRVKDWMGLNEHLFASLRLERLAMFVILAFIVIVASFNIVTTLTLMVLEKRREISILKAMGASERHIGAVFLAEGAFIGFSGVSLGVIAGGVICALLRRYPLIELPEVYYDRSLPVAFDPMYYLVVGVSAALIVLVACVYPSRRASRVAPLEGIRLG